MAAIKNRKSAITLVLLSLLLLSIVAVLTFLRVRNLKTKNVLDEIPGEKEVAEKLNGMLNTPDPEFENMSENYNTWVFYSSPNNLYRFKYPGELSVKTSTNNDGYSLVTLYYDLDPNFKINIGLKGYGGGLLCANNYCYGLSDYQSSIQAITPLPKVWLSEFFVDERLRNIRSDYIEYRLDMYLVDNNDYFFYVDSEYSNGQQREVLRKLVGGLNLSK